MNKPDRIQVHRYHDYAALCFANDDCSMPSVYLTKETAQKLSIELHLLAQEIGEVPFTESVYSTQTIEQNN